MISTGAPCLDRILRLESARTHTSITPYARSVEMPAERTSIQPLQEYRFWWGTVS